MTISKKNHNFIHSIYVLRNNTFGSGYVKIKAELNDMTGTGQVQLI